MPETYISNDGEPALTHLVGALHDPTRHAYQEARDAYVIHKASETRGWLLRGSRFIFEALQTVNYEHKMGKMEPPLPDDIAELIQPTLEAISKGNGKINRGVAFHIGAPLLREIVEHGYRNDNVGERG